MKLRHLDLFSGIGGFALGLQRTEGFETIGFCEIDPYCQKVLKKNFPGIPIFEDVRNFDANGLGRIDIITGGYPCQPFSTAGKRQGDQDDRHLWPAMFEIIKDIRPTWVIGENVAGHVSMGIDEVLSDLESEGYTCRPYIIPACAIDAPHRRDRVWIVAHDASASATPKDAAKKNDADTNSQRSHRTGIDKHGEGQPIDGQECVAGSVCEVLARSGDATKRDSGDVANTGHAGILQRGFDANAGEEGKLKTGIRRDGISGREQGKVLANSGSPRRKKQHPTAFTEGSGYGAGGNDQVWRGTRWPVEPGICRVAHGIPRRVDRLKGLGNAVVPQIVTILGETILAAEE